MNYLELAKKRYSARKFTEKPIKEEDLTTILEAGRVAPTAANKQPQRILVIQTKEGLNKLTKGARFYNAPLVLIVCADKSKAWVRKSDGKNTSDIDASIVTDHMMMTAADLGLDTLWMTWFDPTIIREEFNIPEDFEAVNLLAIGYNADPSLSSERHNETRKKIEETVFFENFE